MKNEINQQLKEFYKKCELWIPDKSSWRYYTFKLQDKSFKRFHIKDKIELRKLLIKFVPLIVYYSSGAWLNSQNIRGRTKTTTYPIKVFSDLVLDVDNDKSLNQARKTTLEIIKIVGDPNYILMTRRGFHLCYFKIQDKNKILEKLKKFKDLDIKCSENDFNVFSLPLTLNKAGKKNMFLTYQELKYASIRLLESRREQIYIPLIVEDTFEKLEKVNEEACESKTRGYIKPKGLRSKINRNGMKTEGIIHSFNNKVKPKLFIPILIYYKNYSGLKKELSYLTEHYDLGDLFCFENKDYLAFISLKVMEKRRLMKLLNSSNSITRNQFKRFNIIWFNISKFKVLGKLNYKTNKFFRASKKHYEFFIDVGFDKSKVNELVGKIPLKIYDVDVEGHNDI